MVDSETIETKISDKKEEFEEEVEEEVEETEATFEDKRDEAKEYLAEFIPDDKALDYIYLYGLHDLGWLPKCKFEDKVNQLKMKEKVSQNKGLIYSYVMHHKLNPPKKIESEMKVGEHRWG